MNHINSPSKIIAAWVQPASNQPYQQATPAPDPVNSVPNVWTELFPDVGPIRIREHLLISHQTWDSQIWIKTPMASHVWIILGIFRGSFASNK